MQARYHELKTDEKTRQLAAELAASVGAAAACLYNLLGETSAQLEVSGAALTTEQRDHLYNLLRDLPQRDPHRDAAGSGHFADPAELTGLPFTAAWLLPLASSSRTAGAIALLWPEPLSPDARARLAADERGETGARLELLRLHLENAALEHTLTKNVSSAQSILMFAETLGDNPSPQRVVDILVTHLLDLKYVSGCALLLLGGNTDPASGEREFLEVRGSWSRRLGSGVALGMRLYVRNHVDALRELNVRRIMTFYEVEQHLTRTDPFMRVLLQTEKIASGTLIALQLGRRPMGVIAVGTDRPHQFNARELHDFRTIAEFLSISVLAQSLQQQRDSVQQGRAALLESVTDGVIMIMPAADTGGTVLTVNQPFQQLFDLTEEQVRGLTLEDLIKRLPVDEETRRGLRAAWMNISVHDASKQRGEFSYVDRGGRALDIQWYSAPVYQENSVLGRIYTFNDVSAERAAARLRATFLSRVSHELRTPLTSIHGFAEFLLQSSGDLPPTAREYTQIILNSAKQLKFLVNDLIDIGRANAGALALAKVSHPVPALLRDVCARLEMEIRRKHQQVIYDFAPDLPPVEIDYERMVQVFANLVTNAIKYAPDNGTITVGAQYVSSPAALDDACAPQDVTLPAIVITVMDSGAGLTSADVEQIFLPFYRTTTAKVKKIEGVGLGLAIAHSLIEAHRGKIWAVPVPIAPGGCFKVTIPVIR